MKNYEWPKLVYMNTRSKKQKEYYYLDYQKKKHTKNWKKNETKYVYVYFKAIHKMHFFSIHDNF